MEPKKINPFSLRPPPVDSETRTFTDPAQPKPLTLTFAPPSDFTAELAISEKAEDYITEYIVNGTPLIPVGGKVAQKTKKLCGTIATLQVLDQEDTYDFQSWAAMFVVYKTAMEDVVAWAGEVRSRGAGPQGEE